LQHQILKRFWARLNLGHKLRKVVFLHIQKTAGTSIVEFFAKHYYGSWISHLDYSEKSIENLRCPLFISGHFGYDYASQWMHDRFSFTFLRSPEDRIVSFYYYCRSCNPQQYEVYQLAHSLTLDEFLDFGISDWRVKPYIWNHQTWQIALGWGNRHHKRLFEFPENELIQMALKNIKTFDYIGLKENFNVDFGRIVTMLGLPYSGAAPKVNAARRTSVAPLPDSTIQKLRNLTMLDRVLYEEVCRFRGVSS